MGPFELMDLVGVDVGLDVSRSFYEQSFGEPRWRPSPITVKTVAAGRLGRKSGRGYYDYPSRGPPPPRVRPRAAARRAAATGGRDRGRHAARVELREAAARGRLGVATPIEASEREPPFLILDAQPRRRRARGAAAGRAAGDLCAAGSLAALDPGGSAVGFHALPPLRSTRLVELTRGPIRPTRPPRPPSTSSRRSASTRCGSATPPDWCSAGSSARSPTRRRSRSAKASAARRTSTPAWSTGSATRAGSSWADEIGLDHVLAVLDALALERGEDATGRRAALRRLGWSGRFGRQTGAGFFEYGDAS